MRSPATRSRTPPRSWRPRRAARGARFTRGRWRSPRIGREDGDRARRATYLRGQGAERIALALLLLKGYRPLARRYAESGGEIDLIVKRGGTIAFIEVKARGRLDDALAAISARKRQRFSRAARAWAARNPWAADKTLRADAVFIAPGRWPRHIVAAFELEMF
jgi:putative endonuclease